MGRAVLACAIGLVVAILGPSVHSAAGQGPLGIGADSTGPAAVTPFFPNVLITDGSSPYVWQVEPTMILNESGSIYVGWKEASTSTGPGRRVGFSKSDDGGATWSPNVLMNQTHPNLGCANSDPWMALAPDDRVYYAYLEYECGSGLTLAKTTDGASWDVSGYFAGEGGLVDKESIAVDSTGRVYVAEDEGNEMFVTWTDDGGSTWAPFEFPTSTFVLGVIVAIGPNDEVYLTWWDIGGDNILFDYSLDRGATWHTDIRVNDVAGSAESRGSWQIPIPAMNVEPNSGAVYVAWPDVREGGQDVFLARSTDGGLTWSENRRVNDDDTDTQYMVDLAVDGAGVVHVAWEDRRTGDWTIYYANSTDGGGTWSANYRVSSEDTPGSYTRPGDYFAIEAGPDDSINIVWTDGRGDDFDIYFARKLDTAAVSVTVTTNPMGLDVTVDGVIFPSPVSRIWPIGSTHTVGVASPIPIAPGSRYLWLSWSDGGAMAHEVIADADLNLTARFVKQHQVSIATSPEGRTVLVDNVSIAARRTFWWDDGVPHWLEAPAQPDDTAEARYEWQSWTDGMPRAHSIAPTAPLSLTATFVREETLQIATSPEGLRFIFDDVEYSSSQTFWLEPGSSHHIFAPPSQSAPGTRHTFVEWSDGGSFAHPILFSGAMSVEARFRTEFYLTVTSPYGEARGGGWYDEGTIAFASLSSTLVPGAAGVRYAFLGWTGDARGAGQVSSGIVMDGPKSAVPAWGTEYFLQVDSDIGRVNGTGWYPAGETVHLSTPVEVTESGSTYRFAGWTGSVTSQEASIAFEIVGPMTVRATWDPVGGLGTLSSSAPVIGVAVLAVVLAAVVGRLAWLRRRRRG